MKPWPRKKDDQGWPRCIDSPQASESAGRNGASAPSVSHLLHGRGFCVLGGLLFPLVGLLLLLLLLLLSLAAAPR